MLDELHVKNLALIEEASVELSSGLTVLTGETGAGKTALLSALKLIGGKRADSKTVRDGAAEALSEARYLAGGEEHVVQRRLTAAGRSRCTLDGSMATVSQLSDALSFVHIHSQHEQVLLLQPQTQLEFLDRYIDPLGAHLEPYREALAAYRKASKHLKSLEEASLTQDQELEYQRFVESQISAVKPQEGEYEALESQLPKLQNAQVLADAVSAAVRALYAEGAACDEVSSACAELARQAGVDDELDALHDRLEDLSAQLDDLVRDLRVYAGSIQSDPAALQETLTRLSALSGLMKRYGPDMEHVFAAWERAQACIQGAGSSPELIEKAKRARAQALHALQRAGAELQTLRKEKAAELCSLLAASVADLAMPDASFEFSFEDASTSRWTDSGPAAIELLYRPAAAASARPLRQIASGGELSRILLALECVLRDAGAASPDDTLVFDEVDAGIGGATGEAVGRRLAQLAKHAQVIVVTHLAQVAAHADVHFVVSKSSVDGVASTAVAPVDGEERVIELARMLSGSTDDAALEHARVLLGEVGA